jgi:hypothetical protein
MDTDKVGLPVQPKMILKMGMDLMGINKRTVYEQKGESNG